MIFPDDRILFTTAEVSKACQISRTSLIRLEESGFFTPYRIDPVTGYRYYDVSNIVEIGRYKRLHLLGLNRSEIADFYHDRIDHDKFLEEQRQKLNELHHFVNELELRHSHGKFLYSSATLPAITCYCEEISSASFRDAELSAYKIYEKVIADGFSVIPDQPPVIISDDWRALSADSPSKCRFTVCIPVVATSKKSHDTHLRFFPVNKAFSVYGAGGYQILPDMISKICEELSKRSLEPSGPLRLIILATTSSSRDEFIFEFMVPVT